MFCRQCGAEVASGAKYCTVCGSTIEGGGGGAPPGPGPAGTAFVPPADVQARTGAWIGASWSLVQQDLLLWIVISLVAIVIASCVPFVLQGALTAGMHYACLRRLSGKPIEFGDMFKGFSFFLATLLAQLLIAIFTFLGLLACIIPALVVAAMYMFSFLFIIDRNMEFWPAMQASHAIVKKDYFGFTLFYLALVLLQVVGVLACLVGVLVTYPMMFAAITIAYKEIAGIATTDPR